METKTSSRPEERKNYDLSPFKTLIEDYGWLGCIEHMSSLIEIPTILLSITIGDKDMREHIAVEGIDGMEVAFVCHDWVRIFCTEKLDQIHAALFLYDGPVWYVNCFTEHYLGINQLLNLISKENVSFDLLDVYWRDYYNDALIFLSALIKCLIQVEKLSRGEMNNIRVA